jgi:hypothetical protein
MGKAAMSLCPSGGLLIVSHLIQQPEDFSMFENHVLHRQEVISTVLVFTHAS